MENFFNCQSSIVNCFGLTEEALSGRPSGVLKNLGCQSRRRVSRDFSVATETVAFVVWALTSLFFSGSSQKERIRSWIKNPHGLNKPQGFPLFEIPRSPFARLRAEHKLYITLLLILTSRFRLHRVLAYSFPSTPKDRVLVDLWLLTLFINNFRFPPHEILIRPENRRRKIYLLWIYLFIRETRHTTSLLIL